MADSGRAARGTVKGSDHLARGVRTPLGTRGSQASPGHPLTATLLGQQRVVQQNGHSSPQEPWPSPDTASATGRPQPPAALGGTASPACRWGGTLGQRSPAQEGGCRVPGSRRSESPSLPARGAARRPRGAAVKTTSGRGTHNCPGRDGAVRAPAPPEPAGTWCHTTGGGRAHRRESRGQWRRPGRGRRHGQPHAAGPGGRESEGSCVGEAQAPQPTGRGLGGALS